METAEDGGKLKRWKNADKEIQPIRYRLYFL